MQHTASIIRSQQFNYFIIFVLFHISIRRCVIYDYVALWRTYVHTYICINTTCSDWFGGVTSRFKLFFRTRESAGGVIRSERDIQLRWTGGTRDAKLIKVCPIFVPGGTVLASRGIRIMCTSAESDYSRSIRDYIYIYIIYTMSKWGAFLHWWKRILNGWREWTLHL